MPAGVPAPPAPVASTAPPVKAPPRPEPQHREAAAPSPALAGALPAPVLMQTRVTTPEAPATPDPTPPVVEQLAPAVVAIATEPDGTRHMTLHLRPETLGQLRIQIDRPLNAPAQIRIEVERPETLTLLRRDAPALEHALERAGLDRAGWGREGVTISFHAAPPVTADLPVGSNPPAADSGQFGLASNSFGQAQQGFAEGRASRTAPMTGDGAPFQGSASGSAPLRSTPARAGLDITA